MGEGKAAVGAITEESVPLLIEGVMFVALSPHCHHPDNRQRLDKQQG
jgi:hypothetical protein